MRPYLKNPFTKIGLVEWLKMKALSSSPSTGGEKKKMSAFARGPWLTPIILAIWEAEIRRIKVQGQANSSQDPISKITRAKWTGSVAQVVERLLCKCKNPKLRLPSHKKKKKVSSPTNLHFLGENRSDPCKLRGAGRGR
jgi:hypothetical protein